MGRRRQETSEERKRLIKMFIRLAIASTLIAFLWMSNISFDAGDWPNPDSIPHNKPLKNLCGPVGSWISFQLFYYFGKANWVITLFTSALFLLWTVGVSLKDLYLRLSGMALLVITTASLLALIQPLWPEGTASGSGGVVGIAIISYLQRYFSKFGTGLILMLTLSIGLILVADDLVVYIPPIIKGAVTRFLETLLTAYKGISSYKMPKSLRSKITTSNPALKGSEENRKEQPQEKTQQTEENKDATDKELTLKPVEPKIYISRPLGGALKSVDSPIRTYEDWQLPPLNLLNEEEHSFPEDHEEQVREKARILERTLHEFRIDAVVVEIDTGPVVTMFELKLGPGVKVKSIDERAKDLARALKAPSVRVVAPIPGKNTIGIEVPNLEKRIVRIKELIRLSGDLPQTMAIPLFLGKDAGGNPLIYDLTAMPHLLIAGTTGSGKSVCINSIIMSMLLTQKPDTVKMILVDPKMVELSSFKDIPHLMCPVVHDVDKAEAILEWLVQKMEERYAILAEAQVRNIQSYNKLSRKQLLERFKPADEEEARRIPEKLPYIVFIIDELADLMMISPKEVELYLARLAQKSRAVGIHMILATQRPEAKVVTGLIKANLPARIAFRVNSRLDSRIVLDQNGAEDLLGAGDMLFLPPGAGKPIRAQGTMVDDTELKNVLEYLAERAQPEFSEELMRIGKADLKVGEQDELFDEAVRIVLETQRGSVSLLQRKLNIGYSRASRLIEMMEAAGIVGEYKGSQAREVTMTLEEYENLKKQMQQELQEGLTE